MDIGKLFLTQPVSSPTPVENLNNTANLSDDKKKEAARDFESLFIQKLLDEMQNTVGDWGMEKEAGTQQIQGLFGMCLSQDLANKGGLGLWKDIYQFYSHLEQAKQTQSVDNKI